jgi:hypothetical protein
MPDSIRPQLSHNPTPVLSCAKTSPPFSGEAETVLYDENARLLYDAEHSSEEDRYILLGMSDSLSLFSDLAPELKTGFLENTCS